MIRMQTVRPDDANNLFKVAIVLHHLENFNELPRLVRFN
jgi:hypothetical protein